MLRLHLPHLLPDRLFSVTGTGSPDQQFVLYDRHAKPGANLGQRIDKIYKDNITKVSIKINKSTPKDLLETVKQELKKKINYPVQYEILQFVD